VVTNVWPLTTVQSCIIHLIRNTVRLASRRDWDRQKRDVKPIHTAPDEPADRAPRPKPGPRGVGGGHPGGNQAATRRPMGSFAWWSRSRASVAP